MEDGDRNDSVRHGYNKSRHPRGRILAGNRMDTGPLHRLSRVRHVFNKGPTILVNSDKKRAGSVDVRDRQH